MIPSAPVSPAQRIDALFSGGVLIQEIIHNWPPDGGGVRRWGDEQGEHTEPVAGLPVPAAPERTADDKLADAQAILADGAVELAALPAPTTPADLTTTVADILTRAAAALNGGA